MVLEIVLKLVVGNLNDEKHYLWSSIKNDITLTWERNQTTAINIEVFEDARKHFQTV